MEVVITDKGQEYLERLNEDLGSYNRSPIYDPYSNKDFDWLVLQTLERNETLSSEGVTDYSKLKSAIKRLLEVGMIKVNR